MAEFDMDAFRARLTELMLEHNIDRKPLAKAAGLGETSIRDIYKEDRNDVRVGTLVKLAGFFKVPLEDLLSAPQMKIAGRIGAGGQILFDAEHEEDAPTVMRPALGGEKLMALEVKGNSMFPKYEDGDVVYVNRDVDGISPNAIGDYCAVHTLDGGTFLKILAKGSIPGRYTLRSLNAPDMEDQEVLWAAPVRLSLPKSAR